MSVPRPLQQQPPPSSQISPRSGRGQVQQPVSIKRPESVSVSMQTGDSQAGSGQGAPSLHRVREAVPAGSNPTGASATPSASVTAADTAAATTTPLQGDTATKALTITTPTVFRRTLPSMVVAMTHLVLLFGGSLCVVMCVVMIVATSVGMTAALFGVGGAAVLALSGFGFRLGALHETKRSAVMIVPSLGWFVRHHFVHTDAHTSPRSPPCLTVLSMLRCIVITVRVCVPWPVSWLHQVGTMSLLVMREGEAFAAALVVSTMVVRTAQPSSYEVEGGVEVPHFPAFTFATCPSLDLACIFVCVRAVRCCGSSFRRDVSQLAPWRFRCTPSTP